MKYKLKKRYTFEVKNSSTDIFIDHVVTKNRTLAHKRIREIHPGAVIFEKACEILESDLAHGKQ